jgi:bifunctional DNA-binding transcriptional regulator/antitoxin component of YhaV-PrlF toxin-antitoxin module
MKTIAETKLTSKQQLTLPQPIRRMLGVSAGDSLLWRIDDAGNIIVEPARTYNLQDIRQAVAAIGPLSKRAEPASVDEMKEGILEAVRSRHGRD